MYLTDTELRVFKVISQRKRIGQGQGVGGREQEERGIQRTVQSKHDFTWLLCPPSFCEEGVWGVKSSSAEMRLRPASCCSAPALCEAPRGPVTAVPPLKWPSLCLLSTPTEQDFHSLLEKDTAVYRASRHWLSLMLRVLVTMRSLLLTSNVPAAKEFIFSKQTKRTEGGGECKHNVGSPLDKRSSVKNPTWASHSIWVLKEWD